jgi:hypothetical protein
MAVLRLSHRLFGAHLPTPRDSASLGSLFSVDKPDVAYFRLVMHAGARCKHSAASRDQTAPLVTSDE